MNNYTDNPTLGLLNAHTSVRHFEAGADVSPEDEAQIVAAEHAAHRVRSTLDKDIRLFVRRILERIGFGFEE